MKTPIEVSEIRKGDLIRIEDAEHEDAREFRAYDDGRTVWASTHQHFLLDRPTPPVELPTEPTLGWVQILDPEVGGSRGAFLGIWDITDTIGRSVRVAPDLILQRDRQFSADHITAFSPATAVPTAALDGLRRAHDAHLCCGHVRDFLTAVDAATGAQA